MDPASQNEQDALNHTAQSTLIATVVGLALGVSLWAQDAAKVPHQPKLAQLSDLGGDVISVDGFWEPDQP